jgi:hypothetical protein
MAISTINNYIFNLFIIQSIFSLIFPTTLMPVKAVILAIQALFLALKFKDEKLNIISNQHKTSLVLSLILGGISFYVGKMNGFNPWVQAKVMFIWPILFSMVMASVSNITIERFIKSLILSTFLINIILIIANTMPENTDLTKVLWESLIFSKGGSFGYYKFDARAIGSYFFLFPITLYTIFTSKHFNQKWRFLNIFNFILMSVIIIFTFRRALILVSICSPIVLIISHILIFKSFKINKKQASIIFGCIALLIISIFTFIPQIKTERYIKSTISSFNFITRADKVYDLKNFKRKIEFNKPEAVRANQMNALLSEWKKSPFLGRGLGSFNKNFLLEPEEGMKHEYDLGYFDMLMKLGVLGFVGFSLMLLVNYISTFKKVLKLSRPNQHYFVALFSGSICQIIANASNPYLFKFDELWILFIPFCFCYLKENKEC